METKSQGTAGKRLPELLVVVFISLGIVLIVISFIPMPAEFQTIIRSIGLGLVPSGLVTLAIFRYASSIAQMSLTEAVTAAIRNRLEQDMKVIDSTVKGGLQAIDITVKVGIEEVEKEMEGLSPLFNAASKLGLEDVLLNRGSALTKFAWFLDAETQKADRGESSQVWIISSSLKGFLSATSEYFDGRRIMERLAQCYKHCDIRIMMTDPDVANSRAEQELRDSGEIPQEVRMNLAYIKRIGVVRECVRFYPGTPTVFAICTTDRMLLNPYPYEAEAFRCFSMIVYKTLNPNADIFHQYLRYHFQEPWKRARPIAENYWDQL